MRVVAAPDKFRGSLSAFKVAEAISRGVEKKGGISLSAPMADGGEGTLDALGGPNRKTLVTGPLGLPVEAEWRLEGGTAVIEMAKASGLTVVGGSDFNKPLEATSTGTGELIRCAVEQGAQRLIIGLGGSASTDGGFGALKAMGSLARYKGIEIVAACDVQTDFISAAETFSPQKGATSSEVKFLHRRLERLLQIYEENYGVSIEGLPRSGAAGGLAGALFVAGAKLVSGFDLIAEETALDELMLGADLVITGEGKLDTTSFQGKVVSGVSNYAESASIPVFVIAGVVSQGMEGLIDAISLTELFGQEKSFSETAACIEDAVFEKLSSNFTDL